MSKNPRVRVAAVIVEDDSILLVRHEKEGRSYWLLPGGGVDFGESLSDALVRELYEEARVDISPGELVLVNDSIDPEGGRHVIQICFTAEIVGGKITLGEDPRVVEIRYVPLDEVASLAMYPAMQNALAAACRADFPQRAEYLGSIWT